MRIAIIGAGAAGLTAAWRLQQAGHEVVVFEANPWVGGRMHTEHFDDGHYLDTGAGWLTSAYHRTLALLEELGEQGRLRPLAGSLPAELLVGGRRYPGSGQPRSADGSLLVPEREADRIQGWLRSLSGYPDDLSVLTTVDHENAHDYLARVSPSAERYVFAPMFEGLFAPTRQLSAEFVRSWAAASGAAYYQVEGGMDAPWRALADRLEVRTATPVRRVAADRPGVRVVLEGGDEVFDGVVVALPPPVAVSIVDRELQPPWLAGIAYSSQVRVYYARPAAEPGRLHVRPVPMEMVASVETLAGAAGAWGSCPGDWEWTLICCNQAESGALLGMDDASAVTCLVDAARTFEPATPEPEGAPVVLVIRWRNAVPVMAPHHFSKMAGYERKPPIVFAGDWTHQACVEGAVRSGEAAAAAFGG